MHDSTPTDEKTILATLESRGRSWRDYFFVGNADLLFIWDSSWGLMAKVIEDDRLARACESYVLERGARRFADHAAVTAAFGPSPLTNKKPV